MMTFTTQKKSLLFNDQQTWIKRDSGLFDVKMGAHDGAEVVSYLGIIYITSYQNYSRKKTVLYRDDGLAVFKN